jgi:hypothetical protein
MNRAPTFLANDYLLPLLITLQKRGEKVTY